MKIRPRECRVGPDKSGAPGAGQTGSTSWPSSTTTRPTENGAKVNAEYTAPVPVTDESTRVRPNGAAASLNSREPLPISTGKDQQPVLVDQPRLLQV